MLSLLKSTYIKLEEYKGSRLYKLLVVVVLIFLPVGLALGYITNTLLIKSENTPAVELNNMIPTDNNYYQGRIVYIDPNYYPNDNITYVLQTLDGKEIILLKAVDQKLQVAEGNYVKVYGTVVKTKDNSKDVLMVDKVLINNN